MRRYLTIQLYPFALQHQAGKDNANTNFLSCLEDQESTCSGDWELDWRGRCSEAEWPPSDTAKEEQFPATWWAKPGQAHLLCRKWRGRTGSIRKRAFSSVKGEPGKESDAADP